ncbi:IS3 family transposase [Corynebacterium macginleyi]|uniref:IS3 family transposase n=1 Tax=Corynebacterium macginleyi TaxID=38290 RepID=UPI00227802E2|nr:IS3 family transposase [Corynebacterium macginleyi]MBK4146422.1 IS3 family transposase [Corynebacterium macginleyi]
MTTEPSTRLTRMCKVLKLNRSSFYKWVNTREKRRLKMCSDALIGAKIKAAFDDEHGLYGAKRIAASLNSDTDFGPINHKKVARIMKSMGLKGFTKRRRCITTRRKPGHRVMPDLLGRKFTANAPNRVYVGDITYLPCKGGKNMYLATVIDTYSRKLAGYALADHMRVSLVIDALAHAHGVRGSLDGGPDPVWWTPDIQPSRVSKIGNLPPCPGWVCPQMGQTSESGHIGG